MSVSLRFRLALGARLRLRCPCTPLLMQQRGSGCRLRTEQALIIWENYVDQTRRRVEEYVSVIANALRRALDAAENGR